MKELAYQHIQLLYGAHLVAAVDRGNAVVCIYDTSSKGRHV